MIERVLTVRQPWADLIVAGAKDVENRTWPVLSTLPQWYRCSPCGVRELRPARSNADHDCSPEGTFWRDGPFPFRLWVHAGQQTYQGAGVAEAWASLAEAWDMDPAHGGHRVGALAMQRVVGARARLGALLGSVTVTGCHHADEVSCRGGGTAREWVDGEDHCSRWAEPGVWHWTLADPQPLDEPLPLRGRLGLWTLPDDVAEHLRRQEVA